MRPSSRLSTSVLTSLAHFHKASPLSATTAASRYIQSLSSSHTAAIINTCPVPRRLEHTAAAAAAANPAQPQPIHQYSAMASTSSVVSANSVIELIKNRRSYYALGKDLTISKERIQEIVNDAVMHVPSSFNAQSNRVVVLFGAEHDKLWDITEEILRKIVPAENWKSTGDRIAGFRGGAGTIMFFEDQAPVRDLKAKFAVYEDKFDGWSTQSDAMLQYTLWVALEAEGLGANLQHYNPLIDERVAAEWNTPADWKLNAQLVFGSRAAPAGERTYQPLESRVKVFGA